MEKDRFDVWALGSSRVLQFRSRMFEKSFYNAGYTMEGVGDFLPFMQSIPAEKYPEYKEYQKRVPRFIPFTKF